MKARNETCEAVDDLAWSFVENPPTTAAGAAALMAYITEMPEWAWPEDIERDLYRALATALVRIAGGVFMTANRKTRWKPKFGPH